MKYTPAIFSAVIWGSGQFLNKQKLKGIIFFFFQTALISIELLTAGAWKNAARLTAETAGRFDFNVFTGFLSEQFSQIQNHGFFIRGVWGLVTLGSRERTWGNLDVYDHSIMLMLGGIIAVFTLIIFGLVWFWNIRDAFKTRQKIDQGKTISSVQYFRDLWKNSFEYIMITPGLILVVFISLVPIIFSILVAFTNYNANFIPPRNLVEWTGFRTFTDIINISIWGSTFVQIFIWTVAWAFIATFTAYAFGMFQALVIRSKVVKFRSFWRGIFILPWAVPGIVSMLIFRVMLNEEGAINQMFLSWGLISDPIPFLSNTFWARLSLILVNVWLGFPYFMALISGIMTTIPQEQYEAAQIDGAGTITQFRKITLPFILAATAPQLLMSITFNFNNFNMIYFLTGGGPANPSFQMAGSTDILISWIFKLTLDQRMYNYASALSIFIFIVIASVSAWNLLRTRAFKEN
ncbi:MAG: sugar ABC transporter permease [Treponema sp.]|jgi:arabinogalactan oligomer/maltooligosaccharide transport system permease protein|nr:sugar ABC transporter permease [Treponema sp.]